MNAAAKLGVSITVNQVGNDMLSTGTPSTLPSIDKTQEWQPAVTLNEDGLLHQLHSTLVQAIEASKCMFIRISIKCDITFPVWLYLLIASCF
jgi:hypothetical protein